MDKVEIRVTGDIELKQALEDAPRHVDREKQGWCMRAGMIFEEAAKWYASGNGGGPQVRTGNLRASIMTEPTEEGGAEVSPHADYARDVEMGTRHSRPYPYMRPAYEETLEEARQFLTEGIGDEFEIGFGQ